MTALQFFIFLGLAAPALIAIAWGIYETSPHRREW
jgi:hypothetical protein